jgi:hypothetical protein
MGAVINDRILVLVLQGVAKRTEGEGGLGRLGGKLGRRAAGLLWRGWLGGRLVVVRIVGRRQINDVVGSCRVDVGGGGGKVRKINICV